MKNTEIELTYLARFIPRQIYNTDPIRIEDIYIPSITNKHSRLRLRKTNNKYSLTKKVPHNKLDASAHDEFTINLDSDEYNDLKKASNKRVAKKRYVVYLSNIKADVDIFLEKLKGLVLIEFEFDSEKKKKNFIPSEECLADVTQEDFIAGGILAGKSYSDIEKKLQRYGYKKLPSS